MYSLKEKLGFSMVTRSRICRLKGSANLLHSRAHGRFCRRTASCDTLSSLENHRIQSHFFSVFGAAKILGFSSSLCLACVLSDAGSVPKVALCHRNIEREVKRKLWKIETTTTFCSMDKNRMECAYLILGIQYESTANM